MNVSEFYTPWSEYGYLITLIETQILPEVKKEKKQETEVPSSKKITDLITISIREGSLFY